MVKYVTDRGGYELVQWERSFPSVHAIRKNPFCYSTPGGKFAAQTGESSQPAAYILLEKQWMALGAHTHRNSVVSKSLSAPRPQMVFLPWGREFNNNNLQRWPRAASQILIIYLPRTWTYLWRAATGARVMSTKSKKGLVRESGAGRIRDYFVPHAFSSQRAITHPTLFMQSEHWFA